jgi:hypothetical protein
MLGRYGRSMDSRVVGLRAQDVYSGLQTVDQTSGIIAAELDATRLTGMAATIASNIKGIDLIKDPKTLKVIAAQQWGIDSIALPKVLEVLQEVDYITSTRAARSPRSMSTFRCCTTTFTSASAATGASATRPNWTSLPSTVSSSWPPRPCGRRAHAAVGPGRARR